MISTEKIEEYGRLLLFMVIKNDEVKKSVGTDIFILLSKELPFKASANRTDCLSLIVSSFVLISGSAESERLRDCDSALTNFLRSLSLDDYTYIMSFLRDAMSNEASLGNKLTTVIHLNSLLISNAPEGMSACH